MKKMDRIYKRPGYLIRRAQQVSVAKFMDQCKQFDVTPVQYACLVAINENPGIDATRLASLIAFDRSTLGSVLERLLSKKLIFRTSSKIDKRIKLVAISSEGIKLLRAIEPFVEKAQDRMLSALSKVERSSFLKLLHKLVGED
jgi:DNA-binding MarR family transcriptional regulator